MALEKKKISEMPADAIMLTEEEAISYHYRILNKWKYKSDVFAYNYGSMFLGISTVLCGGYINNHFRSKLKLYHYGRIASYLPICSVPATICFLLHHELVLKELMLLKQRQCPVCLELRASAIQSMLGVALPFVLAPVGSLALANRFGTYNLPPISNPLEIFKLIRKFVKPKQNIFFGILIGQALVGSAVTYFEAKSIYTVDSKLNELEKQLEYSGKL